MQTAVKLASLAAQAAQSTESLDSDTQALYLDLIETALGEAARKAFAMLPETYQFTGPSYLRGKAEGEARGEAQAVLAVLEARGLVPTEQQRQRILDCTDLKQLNSWVRNAVTLVDVEELFTR